MLRHILLKCINCTYLGALGIYTKHYHCNKIITLYPSKDLKGTGEKPDPREVIGNYVIDFGGARISHTDFRVLDNLPNQSFPFPFGKGWVHRLLLWNVLQVIITGL